MALDKNKYPYSVCLNLTDEQFSSLKEKSKRSNMTLSKFLRTIIMSSPEQIENHEGNIKKLIYEINKIGVNINQIAHAANAGLIKEEDKSFFLAYTKKLYEEFQKVVDVLGNQ